MHTISVMLFTSQSEAMTDFVAVVQNVTFIAINVYYSYCTHEVRFKSVINSKHSTTQNWTIQISTILTISHKQFTFNK